MFSNLCCDCQRLNILRPENSWFSFAAGSAFSESQTFFKNLHLGLQKENWCSLNDWGYLSPEFFKFPWACKSCWNPSQAGLKGNIFYRTFPLEHISLLNLSITSVIPSTHGTGRINEMYPNKLKCAREQVQALKLDCPLINCWDRIKPDFSWAN